eukprot:jgi/Botrbrau1/17719/Bobra.0166s0141.1
MGHGRGGRRPEALPASSPAQDPAPVPLSLFASEGNPFGVMAAFQSGPVRERPGDPVPLQPGAALQPGGPVATLHAASFQSFDDAFKPSVFAASDFKAGCSEHVFDEVASGPLGTGPQSRGSGPLGGSLYSSSSRDTEGDQGFHGSPGTLGATSPSKTERSLSKSRSSSHRPPRHPPAELGPLGAAVCSSSSFTSSRSSGIIPTASFTTVDGISEETVESWFQEAGPDSRGRLAGDHAKAFFQRTQLPPPLLSRIWNKTKAALPDDEHGLDRQQFAVALRLVAAAQSTGGLDSATAKAAVSPARWRSHAGAPLPPPRISPFAASEGDGGSVKLQPRRVPPPPPPGPSGSPGGSRKVPEVYSGRVTLVAPRSLFSDQHSRVGAHQKRHWTRVSKTLSIPSGSPELRGGPLRSKPHRKTLGLAPLSSPERRRSASPRPALLRSPRASGPSRGPSLLGISVGNPQQPEPVPHVCHVGVGAWGSRPTWSPWGYQARGPPTASQAVCQPLPARFRRWIALCWAERPRGRTAVGGGRDRSEASRRRHWSLQPPPT